MLIVSFELVIHSLEKRKKLKNYAFVKKIIK
jgi:hypothetical protein